ncbi:MAG: PaaX family transcriptional regulator [Deltaproteobacteria bacterium]|nr:PaaX family transcriptional regulator [Deltaproteobacteria bacterium]
MADAVSARSLILDLLSTLRRGSMPVRALVEAGALFGLAEGSVRVALTRLLAEGLVERDERGSYRLGAGARAVSERVTGWRRLDERLRVWNGSWLVVLAAKAARPAGRRARAAHERALRLLGFRELAPGTALRPDNLAGGIDAARAELVRLGLAAGSLSAELRALDPVTDARARGLWDGAALVAGYRRGVRELDRSRRRLAQRSESAAMVESFRLGGAMLRRLALDPLLPEPIVPGAERAALVEAMRRYDEAGRACWAPFLERHGVRHRRAPADTRALARGGLP